MPASQSWTSPPVRTRSPLGFSTTRKIPLIHRCFVYSVKPDFLLPQAPLSGRGSRSTAALSFLTAPLASAPMSETRIDLHADPDAVAPLVGEETLRVDARLLRKAGVGFHAEPGKAHCPSPTLSLSLGNIVTPPKIVGVGGSKRGFIVLRTGRRNRCRPARRILATVRPTPRSRVSVPSGSSTSALLAVLRREI